MRLSVAITVLCWCVVMMSSEATFADDCAAVNSRSLHYRGRCYVIAEYTTALSWPEAARTCNDLPNGGLAMWIAKPVFQFLKGSIKTGQMEQSIWIGLTSFPENEDQSRDPYSFPLKNNFFFTQDSERKPANLFAFNNASSRVAPRSLSDEPFTKQPYGLVYGAENPADIGYGDHCAGHRHRFAICQYENPSQGVYKEYKERRLIPEVMTKRLKFSQSASSKEKCQATCLSMPICTTFAFSATEGDCQLYIVGENDLHNTFYKLWLVRDKEYVFYNLE